MAETSLATIHPAPIQPAAFFSPEQEKMILSNFLGGASREEATVLLEIVKRRRLDPFSRQVYFVKRWDAQKREEVWAIQTSIDGLRSIAERTGKYDGQDEPEYGTDDAGPFCKVKVYRKDWSSNRYAMGIAYLSEFIQKKKDGTVTSFWQRMPRLMLAKCAEALAIRKAFPEDTGGLYISEEMPEQSAEPTQRLPPKRAEPVEETKEPEAAAEVHQAEVVETKPAKRETPAHVKDLWDRAGKEYGEKGREPKWRVAALRAFGIGKVPPVSEWTEENSKAVEAALFTPTDVPF